MRTRWTSLAACAVAAVMVLARPAGGAAATPVLALNPDHGPAGTTVAATGSGFCTTCGTVQIDVGATLVAQGITVAADGSFRTTFEVPTSARAGTNAVNAYQSGALVAQTSFAVTPSTAAPTNVPPQPTATPLPPTAAPTPTAAPGGPTTTAAPTGAPSPSAAPTESASPSASGSTSAAATTSTARPGGSGGVPAWAIALIIAGGLAALGGGALVALRRAG